MLFYGISFVSTKIILTQFGPITIIAVRLAISALFLIVLDAIIPVERSGETLRWPRLNDLGRLALVALFEPTLYFIAENYGLQRVSASIASIIIATIPVVTTLLARPFLGERIRTGAVVGFLLSLGGVGLIVFDPLSGRDFTPFGLMLMFLAVLATAGYSIGIRRLPHRYRPLTVVKLQSLISLPIVTTIALAVEGLPTEAPTPLVLGHWLYLAIFPSSIAFVFLGAGIKALGAGRAMTFTNLIPGITAVAAWLLIDEHFSVRKIVGMVIVIAGVFLAQRTASGRGKNDQSAGGDPDTVVPVGDAGAVFESGDQRGSTSPNGS
jgi:drug/metabolite transporter (DMT)-like permease